MLESMRQNIKSLSITLWFVIIAFVGGAVIGGIVSGRRGDVSRQNLVAQVNGKPILYASFESRLRRIYGFYKQVYGDNLTREVLENLQLDQVALNQLIQEVLLAEEARRTYHLSVSDEELVTTIQEMPQFQQESRFDRDLYQNTLRRVGMTPQEFEEQTKEGLLVGKLEHVIKQTVRISEQQLLEDYIAQNEKLEVEGLLVKTRAYEDQAEITDEDIQAYYDVHKETFMTPERVKIQYIYFDPQQIKAEVSPSEEEVLQYYEEHKSEFDKGKEVRARHILFRAAQDADEETVASVKTKAEEILKHVKEGADFGEMAKEHSDDPGSGANGGDLGFFTQGKMVPEFEQTAFALSAGEISDLVRSQFGFHIIKVEEIREEKDPYGKAKPVIIDRLKLAEAKTLAAERSEISYDDLLEINNLQEVASKDKLEVHVSDFFAKGEPIDKDTIGLPQIQDLALTLNAEDKFSQPIETPLGYYIIEFLELKAPYIPELSEVRDNVVDGVRQEKTQELAKAEAERIRKTLRENTSWEEIAEKDTVEIISPTSFNRRQSYISEAKGNSEEFVKTAYALKDNEYSSVMTLSEGYAIIRVKERIGIDNDAFQKEKDSLRQRLLRQKQDKVFREFTEELRQKAEITMAENIFS